MTMRELSQLRYLRREIEREREELAGRARERPVSSYHAAETAETCGRIAVRLEQHIAERDRLETYIAAIDDSLTRQAFVLRFSDGLSWRAVAYRIGGGNTADGIRMQCVRYLRKNGG